MNACAWKDGGSTHGIRVGRANRDAYFRREWSEIHVQLDGAVHTFKLTPGFWEKCPEFRDSGGTAIRDWFTRHFTLPWPRGNPPQFGLIARGDNRFEAVLYLESTS